jgi:hypothetical protein
LLCQETPFNYIEASSVPLKKMFLGLWKICNLRFLIIINLIYNSRIDEMEAVILELEKKMEEKV